MSDATEDPASAEQEEPRLRSDAPAGLAPPPGLAPSPGIRPPEITPPRSFTEQGASVDAFRSPNDSTTAFAAPHGGDFSSVLDQPSRQAADTAAALADDPQQPSPAQPQPQQPNQSQPQQPNQSQPQQPAAQEPPAGKRGLSAGAIVGIVVGAVAALLVFIGVAAGIASSVAGGSGDRGSGDRGAAAPSAPAGAAEAVEQYLTALADGDAGTARELTGGAASDALLSDEVLERSQRIAPISNISVGEAGEGSGDGTVRATFDVGDRSVTREFTAWSRSSGWELQDGLLRIPLTRFDGLDATVNGVDPGDDSPAVFPGAYEIGLGLDAFEVSLDGAADSAEGDAENGVDGKALVIASDEDLEPLYGAEPVLTDEAATRFRELVRDSLEECLASPELRTRCGLDVSAPLDDGAVPVESSAERALTAEGETALDELSIEPDSGKPTRVTSYDYIYIATRIEADRNGESISGTLSSSGELLQPYVDFSEEQPEVTWE